MRFQLFIRVFLQIYLYGYGGSGKIEILETSKDISNKMWLSLGTMNATGLLRAKIKLQNNGDLNAYAKMKLTPKGLKISVLTFINLGIYI